MFAVLAAFYIKQAWSFEQRWNAQAEEYANTIPESSSHLVFDQAGATERFSGIQLSVPWSEIHDYTLQEDRLFIHFLKHRAFVIPFRYLSVNERKELKETLEQNHVRKRT